MKKFKQRSPKLTTTNAKNKMAYSGAYISKGEVYERFFNGVLNTNNNCYVKMINFANVFYIFSYQRF